MVYNVSRGIEEVRAGGFYIRKILAPRVASGLVVKSTLPMRWPRVRFPSSETGSYFFAPLQTCFCQLLFSGKFGESTVGRVSEGFREVSESNTGLYMSPQGVSSVKSSIARLAKKSNVQLLL